MFQLLIESSVSQSYCSHRGNISWQRRSGNDRGQGIRRDRGKTQWPFFRESSASTRFCDTLRAPGEIGTLRVLVFLTVDPRRFLGAAFPFLLPLLSTRSLVPDPADKISSKENTSSPSRRSALVCHVLSPPPPPGTVKEICNRVFGNPNLWIQRQL